MRSNRVIWCLVRSSVRGFVAVLSPVVQSDVPRRFVLDRKVSSSDVASSMVECGVVQLSHVQCGVSTIFLFFGF